MKFPFSADVLSAYGWGSRESRSLGRERKFGGRFHLKRNTSPNTTAHKYREGKVESTLERELNVPEIVAEKANGTPLQLGTCNRVRVMLVPCFHRSHERR